MGPINFVNMEGNMQPPSSPTFRALGQYYYYYCQGKILAIYTISVLTIIILYSGKFLWGPIFADGQSPKFLNSRFNFRGCG
jgi:cytochrome b subunit of formate dehydrogenase